LGPSHHPPTHPGASYQQTQRILSKYAARTISSVTRQEPHNNYRERNYFYSDGHDEHDVWRYERHHHYNCSRSPARDDDRHRLLVERAAPPRANATSRRVLDSCYVQCAFGDEQLDNSEFLMVEVGSPCTVEYNSIINMYTPLHRLVNAYTGLERMDLDFFRLEWQGDLVGWGDDDTAEKVLYPSLSLLQSS
jgi:hypothetical protein